MNALCVVASGKKKVWDKLPDCGPQKARDSYVGPFARKCIDYAVTFYPSSWCILSPRYGFLLPDETVYAPDCAKFSRRQTFPLSIEELARQAHKLRLNEYDTAILLAGQVYLEILREVLPRTEIKSPLLCIGGIGTMMGALTAAVKTKVALAEEGMYSGVNKTRATQ